MTNPKLATSKLSNVRKNSKEQAASQKHNSRILRKMPAPAAANSDEVAFPVGLRVGLSAHRNTTPRNPVLPPISQRPQVTFSTSTVKSSQRAESLSPVNSIRSNNSFNLPASFECEQAPVKYQQPTEKWTANLCTVQNMCIASKPILEHGIMLLLFFLFTLFSFQLVIETVSNGLMALAD